MAELADALRSGRSWGIPVGVRLPPSAPIFQIPYFTDEGQPLIFLPFRFCSNELKPLLFPLSAWENPGGPFFQKGSINLKSKGVVPVAILSTAEFDPSTLDPDTVVFAGAAPVRWILEDLNGDGQPDMLLHFKTQDLNLDSGIREAVLTGFTEGGIPIKGTDSVNIVPREK